MARFRKKPVVIEAVQFDGSERSIIDIMNLKANQTSAAIRIDAGELLIPTLEGLMRASKGDWIIKGIHGELYPCKPDIFEKTYEPVEE